MDMFLIQISIVFLPIVQSMSLQSHSGIVIHWEEVEKVNRVVLSMTALFMCCKRSTKPINIVFMLIKYFIQSISYSLCKYR